jgi:glycosyltransferase involved in cell wall biosynthesis
MHICHIVPSNVGGAARIADFLVSAQSKAGYNVSVVVLKKQDPQWNLFTTANHVISTDVETKKIRFFGSNLLGFLYSDFLRAIKLKEVISSSIKPDLIITHTNNITRIYYLISRQVFIPYIAYVHSDLEYELRCMLKVKWQWLINLVIKISLRSLEKAAGAVFVCKSLLDRHTQLGLNHNNSIVSYNPVIETDLADFLLHTTAESWLRNPSLTTFISAARFETQKDHETLLKAFTQVIQLYPNARLVLLGNGPLMAKYQILAESLGISEYVLFVGYVSNPRAYFSLCRAVILSSHWEGLGMVLVEALASGTTFIASDCPVGPREIFELFGSGTLVKPEDVDELATAICSHINNPKTLLINAESVEFFSEKMCIRKLDELIDLVIQSRESLSDTR